MRMKVDDFAILDYTNGKKYDGRIVGVKTMPNNRVLFTVLHHTLSDYVVKYSSLYLDKCDKVEIIEKD